MADGRYLARAPGGGGEESVLVVKTLDATAARRRRRRPRATGPAAEAASLPLTRVTAIRASKPFEREAEAERWLKEATEAEDTVDVLLGDAAALLGRALHAQAVAVGGPEAGEPLAERAAAARIGYGSGEETAAGRFSAAREIDPRAAGQSRRRRRREDLRPQERVAAVLGGRERIDACETLLLRARADLDAGRGREAALQLRVGLEALLVELEGALADPGHEEDMAALRGRRGEAGGAANAALHGELTPEHVSHVTELLETCERILRRRRVLRG